MGNRDAAVNLHVYKRGVVNEFPKRTAKSLESKARSRMTSARVARWSIFQCNAVVRAPSVCHRLLAVEQRPSCQVEPR